MLGAASPEIVDGEVGTSASAVCETPGSNNFELADTTSGAVELNYFLVKIIAALGRRARSTAVPAGSGTIVSRRSPLRIICQSCSTSSPPARAQWMTLDAGESDDYVQANADRASRDDYCDDLHQAGSTSERGSGGQK